MTKKLALSAVLFLGLFSQVVAQRLFWVERNGDRIRHATITPTTLGTPVTILTGLNGPTDISVDQASGRFFYTDNFGEDIIEADLSDGSTLSTVITTGAMVYFEDIAYSENDDAVFAAMNPDVDGVYRIPASNNDSGGESTLPLGGAGNDYYTAVAVDDGNEIVHVGNRDFNYILVTDFSGSAGGTLINAPGSYEIDLIAVDKATSKVYFTAWNTSTFVYSIFSANPDNTGLTQIVNLSTTQVMSLAVYSQFGKIYYSQGGQLISRNIDGTSPTTLYTAPGGSDVDDISIESDYTAPSFTLLNVADNSTNVPTTSTFSMTFDENIAVSTTTGTANETSIRIIRTTGSVTEATIDRSTLTPVGNTVSFPMQVTMPSTAYHVLIGSKVFKDQSQNNFFGISAATAWNFTTVPGVTVTAPTGTTCVGSNATLPNIVVTEAANSNFAVGSSVTLTLGFEGAGYSFMAGTGSVSFTPSRNISTANINVTTTAITITYTVIGNTLQDALTISGIRFTTTNAANPTVTLGRTGGTGVIDGLVVGTDVGSVSSTTAPVVPVVSYPSGQNFCQGTGMGITVVNATGTSTKWYSDAGLTTEIAPLAGQSSATGSALSVNAAVPAAYTKYVTQTVGSCESLGSTITVTIDPPPTTSNAGTNQIVCGSTATLAANNPSTGTGQWTIISGTGGVVSTPGSPTSGFIGVAGLTYVLQWTITNGTCAASSSTVTIQFDATPTAAAAGADQDICGTSTALAATTPAVGIGVWTIVTGAGGTVATPTSPTSNFTGVAGTTYVLRWTTTNGVCAPSQDDVTIRFYGVPTSAAAGTDQNICGSSTVLAANTPTVGTGLWSIVSGSGGNITTPSSATSNFTGVAGTSYVLRWTISNGGCAASSDDVAVAFVANPTAAAAGSDQAVCGTSATLSANAPAVGTGAWSVVSGSGGTFGNASSASSSFTGTPGSSYVLRWTTSNGICSSTQDDVAIQFIIPPTVASAGTDQTVCGITTTLAGNAATSGTGTWTIVSGAGGTIGSPASATSSFSGTSGVTYTLRWTIAQTGCTSSTDEVTVLLNALPSGTGNVAGITSLCPGVTGSYTVSGIINATSYQWDVPRGLEVISNNGLSAEIKAVSESGGTVSVTGVNDCGTGGSATINIAVLPIPDVSINVPSDIFIDEPFTFSYSSSSIIESQTWTFESNGTSTDTEPVVTYTTSGDFEVTVEVFGENECANSDTQVVHVNDEAELSNLSIKNVVTANGDEKNRYLHIERIERFPGSEVIVVDRMGVEVFRKRDYLNDWDMSKGGNYLPAGNYVCVVKYNGKVYSRSVTIIKGK